MQKAASRYSLTVFIFLLLATPVLAGQPGTLKWAFPMGDEVISSIALGKDGTIYVGIKMGKDMPSIPMAAKVEIS